MEIRGRRVGVMGLGLSGEASARFLIDRGADVIISEARPESALSDCVAELREAGATVDCGGHTPAVFEGCDFVVISPGVPPRQPAVERARAAGAAILSEIELASRHLKGRIAAVTGSNGKSTVTALTAAILNEAGMRARPCGNIGLPLISMAGAPGPAVPVKDLGKDQPTGGDAEDVIYVTEVSSFQLEAIERFRPAAAALLNLSPDHQDRYDAPEDYYAAKARVFMNQTESDIAVLNADDAAAWPLAQTLRARLIPFSIAGGADSGVLLRGGSIVHRDEGGETTLIDTSDIHLPGRHNLENVAASCALAISFGARPGAIRRAVSGFSGLPHRLRFVRTVRGTAVYDDSKATNVGSTIRAVEAFDKPVVLLLGGRDKGGDFDSLPRQLKGRVRLVVTFGEAGEMIAKRMEPALPVVRGGALADATRLALESAKPGDVVILAPACASFDAYSGYAARGDDFVKTVHALAPAMEKA